MSLLRLLTAGKSLVGLKKSESRYHLPGEKSLPKFGSKKNPFRATVFPEKTESGVTGEAPTAPAAENPCGNDSSSEAEDTGQSEVTEKQYACSVPTDSKSEEGEKPEAASTQPAKRGGLKAFLLWRRVRKPKSANVFNTRPLVQGELSLDSVKVIRNDLSESDLEVVQGQPVAAGAKKSNASGNVEPERSRAAPDYASAGTLSAAQM